MYQYHQCTPPISRLYMLVSSFQSSKHFNLGQRLSALPLTLSTCPKPIETITTETTIVLITHDVHRNQRFSPPCS